MTLRSWAEEKIPQVLISFEFYEYTMQFEQ